MTETSRPTVEAAEQERRFKIWATTRKHLKESTANGYARRLQRTGRYAPWKSQDVPDNLFSTSDISIVERLIKSTAEKEFQIKAAGGPGVDGDIRNAFTKYRDFLAEVQNERPNEQRGDALDPTLPLNIILYGPPGTGKTFNIATISWLIDQGIECTAESLRNLQPEEIAAAKTWYREQLQDPNGRISFTTFHQSLGYEEFIEGIRPKLEEGDDGQSSMTYAVEDGIFKSFCERARAPITLADYGINNHPTVWKVSLGGSGTNQTRTECLENGHIRIGWDAYGPDITEECDFGAHGGKSILDAFYNRMRIGDIVLSCYSATAIDAVGVVTGDPEWVESRDRFKRQRNVRWIAKGEPLEVVDRFNIPNMTLSTIYRMQLGREEALQIAQLIGDNDELTVQNTKPYFFIIDEINRGNISRIFGELITLLEETKREGNGIEEQSSILPYSKTKFSIPSNVYVIGTMNTADRSLAQIDTALRRRFDFWEVSPDPSVLEEYEIPCTGALADSIDLSKILTAINARIAVLYDRDHLIGHSCLMGVSTLEELKSRFSNKIIPLLQEYFYDDFDKIRLVLNDTRNDKGLIVQAQDESKYLKKLGEFEAPLVVSSPDTWTADDFIRIYLDANDEQVANV
ncbi:MAG: AAA domain-containing protein [Eggerthellaceae bacterium]|nr:AAA domain-containing protein [Eggerthellaceae bacterium]